MENKKRIYEHPAIEDVELDVFYADLPGEISTPINPTDPYITIDEE